MDHAEEAEILSPPPMAAVVPVTKAVPDRPQEGEDERDDADNEGEDVHDESGDGVDDEADVEGLALHLLHEDHQHDAEHEIADDPEEEPAPEIVGQTPQPRGEDDADYEDNVQHDVEDEDVLDRLSVVVAVA